MHDHDEERFRWQSDKDILCYACPDANVCTDNPVCGMKEEAFDYSLNISCNACLFSLLSYPTRFNIRVCMLRFSGLKIVYH